MGKYILTATIGAGQQPNTESVINVRRAEDGVDITNLLKAPLKWLITITQDANNQEVIKAYRDGIIVGVSDVITRYNIHKPQADKLILVIPAIPGKQNLVSLRLMNLTTNDANVDSYTFLASDI